MHSGYDNNAFQQEDSVTQSEDGPAGLYHTLESARNSQVTPDNDENKMEDDIYEEIGTPRNSTIPPQPDNPSPPLEHQPQWQQPDVIKDVADEYQAASRTPVVVTTEL